MATVASWALKALLLLAIILGAQEAIGLVASWLDMNLMPHTEEMMHRAILIGTGAYVVFMAIPFVPGAEIGLTLLTAMGGALAPLIYLATATSLMLAYFVGRLLPPAVLHKLLAWLRLRRAADFVAEAAEMTDEDLQDRLTSASTSRVLRYLLRYRYVAIALAINMPGSVVLGGGGGIAMMAGLSRLFQPLPFLLTVLIAVLPVPLLFYAGSF